MDTVSIVIYSTIVLPLILTIGIMIFVQRATRANQKRVAEQAADRELNKAMKKAIDSQDRLLEEYRNRDADATLF